MKFGGNKRSEGFSLLSYLGFLASRFLLGPVLGLASVDCSRGAESFQERDFALFPPGEPRKREKGSKRGPPKVVGAAIC